MGFGQYLKDTQGELKHVAWPTRIQTVIYTALVIVVSIFVAIYLGIFDFIFTTGLKNVLSVLPQQVSTFSTSTSPITITEIPTASLPTSTPTQ